MANDTANTTKTEKTVKAPNYTAEQETILRARYTAAPNSDTVAELAKEFGKATRSIVAKLSRMEIYKKPGYVNKAGEKPVKKNELADKLGEVVGLSDPEIDSLEKANKTAMLKILGHLKAQDERFEAMQAEIDDLLGAPSEFEEVSREG